MNRRNLVGTTALVGIASLGMAACTSASSNATAQSVFAEIQYLLPLTRALAAGIAIAGQRRSNMVLSAIVATSVAGVLAGVALHYFAH